MSSGVRPSVSTRARPRPARRARGAGPSAAPTARAGCASSSGRLRSKPDALGRVGDAHVAGRRRCARPAAAGVRVEHGAAAQRQHTRRGSASDAATARRSSARNVASPSSTKISEMLLAGRLPRCRRRCRGTRSPSRSREQLRRPWSCPTPGGPTRTTRGRPVPLTRAQRLGDRVEVAAVVARGLGDASRRRTSRARPRPAPAPPSPRRRRRRPARRTRRSAGGSPWPASPVATSTVSQRARHRGDRLHRRADPQQLTGGHAALGAAGAAGAALDTPAASRSISSCAAEPRRAGGAEPVAHLDALDRLDPHQRARPAGRRAGGPSARASRGPAAGRRPAPRPRRRACRRPCGPRRPRRPSPRAAAASRQRTGSASSRVDVVGRRAAPRRRRPRAVPIATTWRDQPDAERLLQEGRRDRAEGDPGRGLAGAGPLEDRPGVVEAVLLHADEVGVAGPRPGQRRVAGQLLRRHVVRGREPSAATGSGP